MNDQSWQVGKEEEGLRLDKWLAAASRLGSRSRALEAIERGKVFIADMEMTVAEAGRRVRAGETVRLWMSRPGSAKRKAFIQKRDAGLHIVYEDDALLVINKPAGLLTIATDAQAGEASLEAGVGDYLRPKGKRRPLVVHRIDRDTSGLVVFAKTPEAQGHLKEQFFKRMPKRIYQAIVYGHPRPESGTWRDYLWWDEKFLIQRPTREHHPHAKEAISHYRVLEELGPTSLLEISLVTGKQHQIRVQAALRNHQLVGEQLYLAERQPRRPVEFHRQALHALRLEFRHPADERRLKFEAPQPEDFSLLLGKLRGEAGEKKGRK
ncbi:MAG TPA: RluA family pseudouridine synthase [Blastocatellia bacterium]|nr:RluA family pseudouridine synthase [Blastocatellia bacterium]